MIKHKEEIKFNKNNEIQQKKSKFIHGYKWQETLEYPSTLSRIRIATIVVFLVLQRTPKHVNGVDGYSEVAPGKNYNISSNCKVVLNYSTTF